MPYSKGNFSSLKVQQTVDRHPNISCIQNIKEMNNLRNIPNKALKAAMYTLLFWSSVQFNSVAQSCLTLQPHEPQHTRPPCPSPTPGVYSNSCSSSRWCHSAISSSVVPFSSCLQPSQHQGLFQWVNSSHEVAKVLEFQLQHQSFQWTPRTDLL